MDTRIKALVVAHFVAFLIGCVSAFHRNWPDVRIIIFMALLFAEASLLGIWAAFGQARGMVRMSLVITALFSCWASVVIAQPYGVDASEAVGYLLVFSLPCAIVFLVLRGLRRGRRRLTLRRAWELPTREGFQFSIRHLLLATTSVAVVLTLGKATSGWRPDDRWIETLLVVAIVPPCFVLVGLATLWAALGLNRPLPRLSVVAASALLVGLVPPFCVPSDHNARAFVVWSALTGTTVFISGGSLLVVRSAGWRLCSVNEQLECCEAIEA
ncbi:MAG TPA: hypothetical protein VHC22_24820 [Pirellulales bacterium]|nr:hypothetical protein [Pirellulales bacterium]